MSFSFALEEIETTLMTKSTMLTPDDWYNHGLSKLTELAIERAEQRAAQLQAERDTTAYQATCEASRAVYDIAQVYKDAGDRIEYSALIQAFNKICEALK